jgi:5-formyltetrahydrofolate cyclo-ligase
MLATANCIGMPPEPLDGLGRAADPAIGNASMTKEEFRTSMRRLRAAIPPAERSRLAELIEEALFGLPDVLGAETILLFYSFGTEVATAGMSERILGSGKRLLLPYLGDEGTMEAAEFRRGDPLEPTSYGPREPGGRIAVNPQMVDVVVTPGLAFDRAGNRLGYGGGHYDRYLKRMGSVAVRVGIAFSVQIVDHVPSDAGDQRVDVIVTDQEVLDLRPVQ